MQSGGYAGSGVHDSPLRTSYLTLVGCPTGIDYTGRVMPEYPNPMQYREFYNSPDTYLGSTDTSDITDMEKHNANCIKSYFQSEGWTLESICGMLGNMQYDSSINPAFIMQYAQKKHPENEVLFWMGTNFPIRSSNGGSEQLTKWTACWRIRST